MIEKIKGSFEKKSDKSSSSPIKEKFLRKRHKLAVVYPQSYQSYSHPEISEDIKIVFEDQEKVILNKRIIDICVIKCDQGRNISAEDQVPLPCLIDIKNDKNVPEMFWKNETASLSYALSWDFGIGGNYKHMERIKKSIYHKLDWIRKIDSKQDS